MSAETVTKVKRVVPSDIDQIWAVTLVEFRRNLRRKRLLAFLIIIGLVTALVLTLLPLLGNGYPSDPTFGPYTFSQFFSSVVNFFVVLLAVFFGGDAIVSEFHSRTGYSIFPNPVRRRSLFLGKVFASFLACAFILGVYYLVMAVCVAAIYQRGLIEMLYSFSFALLYTSAAVGVAFFISALMRTTTSAIVLTFVLFLFILNILNGVLIFVGIRPEPLLTFQGALVSNFLNGPYPEFFPTDIKIEQGDFKMLIFQPKVDIAIVVTLIWMVTAYVLAYLVFRRREMLG